MLSVEELSRWKDMIGRYGMLIDYYVQGVRWEGCSYQGYKFQTSRDLFDFDRILHDYPICPGHLW